MSELPRSERLQVRVLIGTLKMLEGQLREMDPALIARTDPALDALRVAAEGSFADVVRDWKIRVEALHAATVDAPEPAPVRPKTMDAGS